LSIFAAYSRYYDLLYRDKDYAGEARHVFDLLARHAPASCREVKFAGVRHRH
jgi:hypothetical protein